MKLSLSMLLEGGLGGHISHVYDDVNLSFGDLKKIISLICNQRIDIEETPRLKTDGQNMFVSFIDGNVRFARNKGDARDYGKNSLTIERILDKWKDSQNVMFAFSAAYKVISEAFSRLRKTDLEKIFLNGQRWLNIEVVYIANHNVIDYNANYIVLHDIQAVDVEGNTTNADITLRNELYSYIEQANASQVDDFQIKNNVLQLKRNQINDDEFLSELEDIMGNAISDTNTIGDYIALYVENKYGIFKRLPLNMCDKLLDRLVYENKGSVSKEDIKKLGTTWEEFKKIEAIRPQIIKEAVRPISIMFGKIATLALQNVVDFLATDSNAVVDGIKSKLNDAITQIENSANEKWHEILLQNLYQIQELGGIDMLSPTEGLVFKYSGKYYKLTGLFASINQIIGVGKYGR